MGRKVPRIYRDRFFSFSASEALTGLLAGGPGRCFYSTGYVLAPVGLLTWIRYNLVKPGLLKFDCAPPLTPRGVKAARRARLNHPKLTAGILFWMGACLDSVEAFAEVFPEGAAWEAKNVKIAVEAGLNLDWFAEVALRGEQLEQYFSSRLDERSNAFIRAAGLDRSGR